MRPNLQAPYQSPIPESKQGKPYGILCGDKDSKDHIGGSELVSYQWHAEIGSQHFRCNWCSDYYEEGKITHCHMGIKGHAEGDLIKHRVYAPFVTCEKPLCFMQMYNLLAENTRHKDVSDELKRQSRTGVTYIYWIRL